VADVLPGFDIGTWNGVLAPAKTPTAVIARLYGEIRRMTENAEARELAAGQGAALVGSSPDAFTAYMREQIDRFGKLAKATGLRAG
jgi:tripartite-type tricarboxylate transporter receptor subunit TctC